MREERRKKAYTHRGKTPPRSPQFLNPHQRISRSNHHQQKHRVTTSLLPRVNLRPPKP